MNVKKNVSVNTWIDEDDAPELDDTFFSQADLCEGDKVIRRGRPLSHDPKIPVKIRLDADVVEKLRASGKGWQTRVNGILREYVSVSHK